MSRTTYAYLGILFYFRSKIWKTDTETMEDKYTLAYHINDVSCSQSLANIFHILYSYQEISCGYSATYVQTFQRWNLRAFYRNIVATAINKLYPLLYFNIFENFITRIKALYRNPLNTLHVTCIFNVREASENIVKIV